MTMAEFIRAHEADDPVRLLLARDRYPDVDVALAASTLACRNRLRTKVPEWHEVLSLVFPDRLAAEQCSSSETARYKAQVAARVLAEDGIDVRQACAADLTGGLGVDSWAFAEVFGEVLYNERQTVLADAARANFKELDVKNIRVVNRTLAEDSGPESPLASDSGDGRPGTVADILGGFVPDLVFLDPARRAEDGRKVFLLEDCRPAVLKLLPALFAAVRYVLVKLSPMADISMCVNRLGHVREVHAVAAEGECKELLLLLDRDWDGGYSLTACAGGRTLTWTPEEEAEAPLVLASAEDLAAGPEAVLAAGPEEAAGSRWLFEPGKALLKAGAFRLPCARYGLKKLDVHTHLFVGEAVPVELAPFGKTFRILAALPLNNRTLREAGRRYPRAETTARNLPMDSELLRKKAGCASGGDIHLFGVRTAASGPVLMITKKT